MVEHLKDFPSNVVVAVDRPEGAAMKPFEAAWARERMVAADEG